MTHLSKLTTLLALLAAVAWFAPSVARADRDQDVNGYSDNDRDGDHKSERDRGDHRTARSTSQNASVPRVRSNSTTSSSRSSNSSQRRAAVVGTAASPTARGTAEIETKSDGTRELEVEVRSLNLSTAALVSISVDGRNLGNARVSRGRIHFKVRSLNVPAVGPGSNVVLRTLDGGTVAAGSF